MIKGCYFFPVKSQGIRTARPAIMEALMKRMWKGLRYSSFKITLIIQAPLYPRRGELFPFVLFDYRFTGKGQQYGQTAYVRRKLSQLHQTRIKQSLRCCCSVAKSCPPLCNPMDCSVPGLPVPHYLPEFAQVVV